MIYLSQLLGNPVIDASGEKLGVVSDLGIATGEVFPRITSLAFTGPGKTPFMISWRKYVESYDEDEIRLSVVSTDVRFSYLQPNEVLLARDILNKQIVDTRGMRVVRVNDLKLSDTSSTQLRLLGAEVGARGLLRSLAPWVETVSCKVAKAFGKTIPERIIAWSYMDLVERDLSNVKLSVSHKTLDDMHPADVADIIEQLDPRLRGTVFAQLDEEQRAEAVAELDDDEMAAELLEGMEEREASRILSAMDPDDAAELVSELDYEKAEKLLRLMGVSDARAIRQLLGYREDTAGRIMTQEVLSLPEDATVADAIAALRGLEEDFENVHYVYLVDDEGLLTGVVSLNHLIIAESDDVLRDIAHDELVTASPEDDQEDVAEDIAKYNLLAIPVVDDAGKLLGIVTVDDALDVLEEEHEEDLAIVGGRDLGETGESSTIFGRLVTHELWIVFWAAALLALSFISRTSFGDALMGVQLALALPVALRATINMTRYVTDVFLEFDADDDDAPSILGFTIRGIGLGLAYAAVLLLILFALGNIAPIFGADAAGRAIKAGIIAAAGTSLFSFITAPLYLIYIRKRDEKGEDPSGQSLRSTALIIATVIFCVAAVLLGA